MSQETLKSLKLTCSHGLNIDGYQQKNDVEDDLSREPWALKGSDTTFYLCKPVETQEKP